MDIEKTKLYYEQLNYNNLCDCVYCKNYICSVRSAYPGISDYLSRIGVNIEKPFETIPLEPDASGYIEYICAQYVVLGHPDDFEKASISSVNLSISESHPATAINEPHFVIEIYPIRLKWVL